MGLDKIVELSELDMEYILHLMELNKEKGMYWGIKKHFDKRQNRLIKLFEKYLGI